MRRSSVLVLGLAVSLGLASSSWAQTPEDAPPSIDSVATAPLTPATPPRAGVVRIVEPSRNEVLVEGPLPDGILRVALPAGRYLVQWESSEATGEEPVDVALGATHLVAAAHLELRGVTYAAARAASAAVAGEEHNEPGARAELGFYQTLHGIGVGIEICAIADCGSATAWIGVPTLAAGAGLTAALLATPHGITPGRALAIDTGTSWGFWQALVVANVSDRISGAKEVSATLMVGQAVGLGAGTLAGLTLEPTAGSVALADAIGTWAGVLTLLGHAANDWKGSSDMKWLTILAASDVGFLGGALLAPQISMSRGRTLVIDAGGILGMLAGMAGALAVKETPDSAAGFFGPAIGGSILGLGLATWLTQGWDVPDVPVQAMLLPTDGGAVALVGMRL